MISIQLSIVSTVHFRLCPTSIRNAAAPLGLRVSLAVKYVVILIVIPSDRINYILNKSSLGLFYCTTNENA